MHTTIRLRSNNQSLVAVAENVANLVKIDLLYRRYQNQPRADRVPQYVQQLKSGTDGQKEIAANALGNLAANAKNRVAIGQAAGVIPALVALVSNGTCTQKEQAAQALRNLTCNNAENTVAIIDFFLSGHCHKVAIGRGVAKLFVPEIKALLMCFGLSVGGKKAVLVEGLRPQIEKHQNALSQTVGAKRKRPQSGLESENDPTSRSRAGGKPANAASSQAGFPHGTSVPHSHV